MKSAFDLMNSKDSSWTVEHDFDGDGLADGLEKGVVSVGPYTDATKFVADLDPTTATDPLKADTDSDNITDGKEDANRNGRLDSGEADPGSRDTDRDGLVDGWWNYGTLGSGDCTGGCLGGVWGEDLNGNGVRDQDSDGSWTETDFLANDSDVDGVLDGVEVWGRWCYKGETMTGCWAYNHTERQLWVNQSGQTPAKNGALIADFDGEGLRDGQELAGWMVGVWWERTMAKKVNYSVVSNPFLSDSEGDTLTDFEEFMNGSDPWALDTDGDRITDPQEIDRKSNITGIEGTPPRIENVRLRVELVWRATTGCLAGVCTTLYTPDHLEMHVVFTVTDPIGVDRVSVRVTNMLGRNETVPVEGKGALSVAVDVAFRFGLLEAVVIGADVNITVYDVNENGAWGQFHQDSIVEFAAKVVVAYFTAIARVAVEAASAAVTWVLAALKSALEPALRPVLDWIQTWVNGLGMRLLEVGSAYGVTIARQGNGPFADTFRPLLNYVIDAITVIQIIVVALTAAGIVAELWTSFAVPGLKELLVSIAMTALASATFVVAIEFYKDAYEDYNTFTDFLEGYLPGGKEVLENEISVRDLFVSFLGFLWELLSALLGKVGGFGFGFALSMIGLLITTFGLWFESTQVGQIAIFKLWLSLSGLALTVLGMSLFMEEEVPTLRIFSKILTFIKTTIVFAAIGLAAASVTLNFVEAADCIILNKSYC